MQWQRMLHAMASVQTPAFHGRGAKRLREPFSRDRRPGDQELFSGRLSRLGAHARVPPRIRPRQPPSLDDGRTPMAPRRALHLFSAAVFAGWPGTPFTPHATVAEADAYVAAQLEF